MVRGWTPGMTPKNYSLPRKKMFRHNIGIRQFGLYFSLFYCCLSVRLFAHIFDFDQRIHQELFLNSVYISFSFRIWCRPLDSEKKFLSNGMHTFHFDPHNNRNLFTTAMKLLETTHFRCFPTKWTIFYHHLSSDLPEIAGHLKTDKILEILELKKKIDKKKWKFVVFPG